MLAGSFEVLRDEAQGLECVAPELERALEIGDRELDVVEHGHLPITVAQDRRRSSGTLAHRLSCGRDAASDRHGAHPLVEPPCGATSAVSWTPRIARARAQRQLGAGARPPRACDVAR